jgi:hypothetical protein
MLLLGVFNILGQPWVLQKGWNWHIAPAFDLPRLSYGLAFVIYALVGLCTLQHIPRDNDKSGEFAVFETTTTLMVFFVVWVTR